MLSRFCLAVLVSTLWAPTIRADGPALPPGDKEPVLRVETGGPSSLITALAFSPDGKTLYAGGWDKVIHAWQLNDKGEYVADPTQGIRVPVGPGLYGAINTLAVSDDGKWIACGGKGVFRNLAGFRQTGFIVPTSGAMDAEMQQDMGLIYVFNARDKSVRLLRGHTGTVSAVAFAPTHASKPPLLVSVARERRANDKDKFNNAVRLWDADKGTTVARTAPGLLPDKDVRQLAVWHVGDKLNEVRVVLPLGNGNLSLWEASVAGSQGIKTVPAAQLNLTAILAPSPQAGPPRVLTADPGINTAKVRAWDTATGLRPLVNLDPPMPFTPDNSFPGALGLASSQGDGKADLAAVVIRNIRGKDLLYRLQILDLNANGSGARRSEQKLWQGRPTPAVLASAPRGDFIAVAGNAEQEILVFKVKDLLQPGPAKPQTLKGLGKAWHYAAFATDGKSRALVLNRSLRRGPGVPFPPLNKDQGDILFDFAKRRLVPAEAPWRIDAPDLTGWRIEPSPAPPNTPTSLRISRDGQPAKEIKLPPGHRLVDFAFTPQTPAVKTPLLALALDDLGQPKLALFNASTGEEIRQLTGHSDRIVALGFSGDGRLLASVGDDETACVWSLTDVDKLIGRRGQIKGLVVRQRQDKVEVLEVQDGSPAKGKIQPGDTIAGLVLNRALRPVPTALAYYEAIFRAIPGRPVTLRCNTAGREHDESIDVIQGIDERKPLFTLAIIQNEAGNRLDDLQWIGWNPVGPYEASSPQAERYLGWHFNTGDAKAPIRFARADAHHNEYYREGILQKMIDQGELGRVEARKAPRPGLVLWIEEDGKSIAPVGRETLTVRHARVALNVQVLDRPLASLGSLTWKLDDGVERAGSTALTSRSRRRSRWKKAATG